MADADDETTTAPPPPAAPAPTAATPDMLAQAQQLAQQFLPAPVQVDTTPVKRSWLSLLGEAVGGGKQIPMSPADEQRAGLRALGDFGTSLMAASHYQPGQTVFSNLAQGFQGAERSMTGSEQMAAGTLAAQQGYQQQQLQNRLAALKEAIPLLRMQQAAGMPNPLAGGGGGGGGNLAATGDPIAALPKNDALPAIVQRESGGQNINTRILGPDGKPASTASGYYQMLDGTWQEGAALAGIKNPPARAIDASKADQDAAASALFDKHGYAPWAKSAPVAPTTTAAAPSAPTTPPSPVARPPAAPATPSGTIQGTPDTGGTQVGGPGALPGVIRPPGPLVPGDVGAIVGGMTKAGASPTTLAPGTATAGPTAPTIAQAGSPTVTPPAQPTPQQPTQADQPPAPGGKQTFEQYQAQHPMVVDPATYTVPPPDLSNFRQAQQAASQAYRQAQINGDTAGMSKATAEYNAATKSITDAPQAAVTKSLELRQAAEAKARADQITLYNADQERLAAPGLEAQRQAGAENLARINAGTELEKGDADQGRKDIDTLNTNAMAASNMQSLLSMIGPNLKDLPSATVGALLQDHPQAIPFLTKLHLLDGPTANATQLLQGLTAFMAAEMKPKGLGPLRIQEMNAFQGALPGLLQSDEGRQKMFAFMNAYSQRIIDEADFSQKYFMRDKPNPAPGASPGSTVPTRNTYGMWSQIGKPTEQGGLGSVMPMYTGGMKTADDAAKYSAWEQQQQAQPGHVYWGLRKGADGQRHMELQMTPPAGG